MLLCASLLLLQLWLVWGLQGGLRLLWGLQGGLRLLWLLWLLPVQLSPAAASARSEGVDSNVMRPVRTWARSQPTAPGLFGFAL